jgi:hypothetical protein
LPEGEVQAVELLSNEKFSLQNKAIRVSLWKSFFTRVNMTVLVDSEAPQFLAVLEFKEQVDASVIDSMLENSSVAQFKLLRAFGDKVSYFTQ